MPQQITTVTKYTNQDGNRLDERIVTSTIFGGRDSQRRFNNLTDAQFRGTYNHFCLIILLLFGFLELDCEFKSRFNL